LHVIGDGPLRAYVEAAARTEPHISYLGFRPRAEILAAMGRARLVIAAPLWEEPFGLTVAEAFGCATPVVASDMGAAAELLVGGGGALFPAGDSAALAATAAALLAQLDQLERLSAEGRRRYETTYTPAASYERLVDVYREALRCRHSSDT
jgi:glycosyltransferase involved in cell wall biosynthesis